MADWFQLVELHGPDVWLTAYRLLGNHADAADCFQETFLAAVVFSRREHVESWGGLLRHLATLRALDQLRQRSKRSKHTTQAVAFHDIVDSSNEPSQFVEAQELAENLRTAIRQLPPQEASVFCLRALDELSYDEIGQQLGLTRNAVGVLLHKARNRLRKLLNKQYGQVKKVNDEHSTRA